jgi:hypothetical protein
MEASTERNAPMSDRAIPETASERPRGVLNNGSGSTERVLSHDAEMAEVALLLPSRQATALERVARRQGLTVGQLIRCLIRDCLASEDLLPLAFAVERKADDPPAGCRT